MIRELIQLIALLLLMLVTGIFWGPWFSLHRSMKGFSKEEFIHIVKTMSNNLAVPMRIMMPSRILFIGLSVCIYPQKNSFEFYLNGIALILILVSLIITIVVEVPIVKQIEQWEAATAPSNMEAIQNRWLKFHVIRTFTAIISFISFASSIIFSKT